ncbi:hypothetical protein EWM64_g5011 [Hericium alpestre]|uniref:Glucose-methanol-choline oxidoreductase C-terminal domain-containing protein n=1 Tax=Hericium alpestre TaxID=135208 RepID=A0A4Y9ZY86_9AGAM|nr:hypothetical protein EWM64_g5011 [Hericium alpestre]
MIEMVDDEPVVTINRERPFNNDDPDMKSLRKATDKVMETLQEVLNIEFLKDHTNTDPRYFQPLELGGVAHELGTIPMRGKSGGHSTYCLDEDLKLVGHDGVYVCDLSVFPMSPEVNPTLTLAALALRLSREVLAPRLSLTTPDGDIISTQNGRIDPNTVYVVNHSGMKIRVFVGNRADVYSTTDGDTELEPGEWTTRTRCAGTAEAVSVFRLAFNSLDEFLAEPELRVAHPGTILPIH